MTPLRSIFGAVVAMLLLIAAPVRADYDSLLATGNAALSADNYAEAEVAFKQALAVRPGSREALTRLGITYLRSGHLRDAFAALQIARTRYPQAAEVHLHLAEVYYRAGLGELERGALTTAIRFNPRDLTAHRHLAHALAQAGELYAASVEFDYLIARAEQDGQSPDPTVLHARALIYERHGQLAEAQRMLVRFVTLYPDHEEADKARAHIERLEHRFEQQAKEAKAALKAVVRASEKPTAP